MPKKADLSTNALVYEAVQRHFRNAVVNHLRERLQANFPTTWLDELKKPFKTEEWEGICSGVELVKAGGNVEQDYRDEFDYLSVNHFFNLFERHFKVLIPETELPSDDYLPKLRQDFLGWLREIKSVRDPVAHPPQQDLPTHDAWRVVDSCRRVLTKLHLDESIKRVEKIRDHLSETLYRPAPPDIFSAIDDTLPPSESVVIDFVGRRLQLTQLRSWFADPLSRRWLLVGDGGKGKSAIAYEFASEVRAASPDGLAGVFWISAKRRKFDEGTVVEIAQPDFYNLDSLLDSLLTAYGWTEDLEKSTEAKRLTALGLLDEFPSLLVVDDLDSIQADHEDDVHEFLTLEVPKTATKILITSRRQFIGLGKTCTVIEGLTKKEADVFIESRLGLLDIRREALNDSTRSEIIEVCEASPLYMEDLLRFCKFLPPRKAIQSWRSKPGNEVRQYALVREIEMLSSQAREALGVCSLLDGAVSVLELQRVLGLDEDTVIEAVDELRKMYLVPAPEIVEGIPRFTVNRNLASLMRSALRQSPQKELELRNAIRQVFEEGLGKAHAKEVSEFSRQARVLVETNRFDDAERAIRAGLEKYPNHPKLLGMLGWVYKNWDPRRTADARSEWERASQLRSQERSMYFHWSSMEQDEGNWEKAAEIAEIGAERCGSRAHEDWRLLWAAGYARSRCGQALKLAGRQDEAKAQLEAADYTLRRAVRLGKDASADPEDISRAYRSWVITARERGDLAGVCSRLIEWLEWRPDSAMALELAEQYSTRFPDLHRFLKVPAAK